MTHKHYLGAQTEFEILKELDGREGFFIKVFFVNDKVNGNKWQITWEGIQEDANDVVGIPIVLQDDLQHPEFSVQNFFAKGYIVDFILNERNHTLEVIARILDPEVIKLIKEKKIKFTSPAVVARDNLSIKNVNGVDILSRWIALHLALVAVPAYGKADAKITATCTGKGDTCSMKLKQLSASQIASIDDCVSKILSKKLGPGEKPSEQDLAIAFSECREKEAKQYSNKYSKEGTNPPGSDAQKMGPLTQTPLIRHKIAASMDYITSKLNSMKTGSMERDGVKGYWIEAKGIPVFVAHNRTVDQAISEQCPCQFKAGEIDLVVTKEQANYRYAPTLEVQCRTCKFFNSSTASCQVVEGFIRPGFLSDKYEPIEKDADGVTDRT